jgi:hypothetical protein
LRKRDGLEVHRLTSPPTPGLIAQTFTSLAYLQQVHTHVVNLVHAQAKIKRYGKLVCTHNKHQTTWEGYPIQRAVKIAGTRRCWGRRRSGGFGGRGRRHNRGWGRGWHILSVREPRAVGNNRCAP